MAQTSAGPNADKFNTALNPQTAGNFPPVQAHNTLNTIPPMGIPGQWQYPSTLSPVPGAGTAQYQNAFNPLVAPNLSQTPLGVNPNDWASWMATNSPDRSWDASMAGINLPRNPDGSINVEALLARLTPAQRAMIGPAKIAELAKGGNGIASAIGGLGGLGGLSNLTPQQNQWFSMMDEGRKAVAGINRMPFMFSNYGGIPTDPATVMNMFYPKGGFNNGDNLNAALSGGAVNQPTTANANGAPVEGAPTGGTPSTGTPSPTGNAGNYTSMADYQKWLNQTLPTGGAPQPSAISNLLSRLDINRANLAQIPDPDEMTPNDLKNTIQQINDAVQASPQMAARMAAWKKQQQNNGLV